MWGVFDFVCLDFFVAFFIPAGAPSFPRSASGLRLSPAIQLRTENFLNQSSEDGRVLSVC